MKRSIRLCLVGPMVGRNRGFVVTGERLADLFGTSGYPVIEFSSKTNRYVRFLDILRRLTIHRKDVDVVILQVFSGPSFVVEDAASWLAKKYRLPIIMFLRGGAMPEFMDRFPNWTRRVLLRADRVVAPSRYLQRNSESHGLKTRIIPNVLDIERYPFTRREKVLPRLFWMRSFHEIYNPEMAVKVAARLRRVFRETRLIMGGPDKGLEGATKRLAIELGVADIVDFCGFLDFQQKLAQASASDIFINTNRVDNVPVSVLEACALGLPIVSTDPGGIRDLLTDGSNGLIVPSGNVNAMVGAVLQLVQDPSLTGKLSLQGRALAEQCSWQNVEPLWEEIFSSLL